MRIEATFLRSAVGRRVFWVLLAAAGVPLLLFAAFAYNTLASQLETQARQRLLDAAKYSGLRAYDRLVAAQGALSAVAAGAAGSLVPTDTTPLAAREMLQTLATVDLHDGRVRGDQTLAELWSRLHAAGDTPATVKRRLWWQGAAPDSAARVIVGVRDAGRWWLAEVSPAFLWSDLRDAEVAEKTCVHEAARGTRLLCGPETAPPPGDGGSRLQTWSLFLGGEFAAPDWVFTRRAETLKLAEGETSLRRVALLGALGTLLLVGMASLVLVRRSTAPLESLIEGTRRLARRDWSARVQLSADDEYAQLAQSFNEMAQRIGGQVQAMQVQASIDREILSGLDLPRVMQQVVLRMAALLPAAQVAVLLRREGSGRWNCFRADALAPSELALPAATAAALDSEAPVLQGELQPWVRGVFGVADGNAAAMPARWAGRTIGVMLMAWPDTAAPDADAWTGLAELRDRLAVTLSAAAREHELRERAERDSLTGLANRASLVEKLDGWLAAVDATGEIEPLTLFYIDLDGFKEVNDTHGHPVGDDLLCQVAALLVREARGALLVARPGGDEFVIVTRAAQADADALATTLCRAIEAPRTVGEHHLRIGASIGLVRCPEHGRDRIELMRRADMAMYAAKSAGRACHAWFDAALDASAAERAWTQRELREALRAGHLVLHYQPRVVAAGARLASVEALVRWQHPQRGLIGPEHFITVAEETGLIDALGAWVLDESCRQLRCWRDALLPLERVAVNVSAHQLQRPAFAGEVLAVLARHGLRGSDLEIELTESLFVGDTDAVTPKLQRLRDAGVRVALDDFGTGFSSLSSLYRLPVDVLKIDRAFVVDLGRREAADAVARSIVALARALGKQVVAEGVETEEQQRMLLALGCDELQGYRFARPLPAAALEAYAAAQCADAEVLV